MSEKALMKTKRAQSIEKMMSRLSPERREEVIDFIEFLLNRDAAGLRLKMTCNWAGGLEDLRREYTSVALQHKASEWRTENAISD